MKVKMFREVVVDVDHLDPKFVDVRGFACDVACEMATEEMREMELMGCDFQYVVVGEDLYFDKPTQLKIEERVDPCSDLVCYGAIGFQDKIICMDNGHVHPTSAVGDYLTIVEVYHKWLNLSDEVIGN